MSKKRATSLLLTLALCLCLLPASALAAEWRYGILDAEGKAVTEMQYENLGSFSEGLIAFRQDGKWGYMDETGKVVIEPAYDQAQAFSGGVAAVGIGTGENEWGGPILSYGLIDKTGKTLVEAKYANIDVREGSGLFVVAVAAGEDEWGDPILSYGAIDRTGKLIIPAAYYSIEAWGDSLLLASVRDKSYNYTCTLFNSAGKKLLDGYSGIEQLPSGLLRLWQGNYPDTRYGAADRTGKVIVPVEYGSVSEENSLLLAEKGDWSNRTYDIFNANGKKLLADLKSKPTVSAGYVTVCDGGVCTVTDSNGNTFTLDAKSLLPSAAANSITAVGPFSEEGLAHVSLNTGMYHCYINTKGSAVLSFYNSSKHEDTYQAMRDFSEGMAAVQLRWGNAGANWGFIDATGKPVIPTEYHTVKDFSGGIAVVRKGNSSKWGAIDKTGKVIVPFEFDYEDSIAVGGSTSFDARLIPAGYIRVRSLTAKYGLYSTGGTVILPQEYSNITFHRDADGKVIFIEARNGNEYSFFTPAGKLVDTSKYGNFYGLSSGMGETLARVTEASVGPYDDGQVGVIDLLTGKEILPVEYEDIQVSSSVIFASKNGLYGAFDRTGKALVPMEYRDIYQCGENGFFAVRNQIEVEKKLKMSSWAAEGVNKAIAAGLYDEVLGKDLTASITRAQAAAVAVKIYLAMGGQDVAVGANPFSDTDDPNVLKAAALGIVSGSGGRFNPNGTFNREEVAVILGKVYKKLGGDIPSASSTIFADNASISSWARGEVAFMNGKGIIKGDGTNFNPKGYITGEAMLMLGIGVMEGLKVD